MDFRDRFYSKYVSTQTSQLYGEVNLEDIKKQFPIWRNYFGRFLPKDKNIKILDLGCGNGGFVYWLQQVGYQNVEGMDIGAEQVNLAKNLGIKNILKADANKFLKNKKDHYNVIFMRDFIEHFNKEEILDILGLVNKSLRSDGILIIQTLNAENLFFGRLRYGDFTHCVNFTRESIAQVLRIVGFSIVNVYGIQPVVHGIKSLIRFNFWKFFEIIFRFYLLVETGSSRGIFSQNIIATAKK